ncbi:MAG TPA: hypothetical protein VFH72_14890 [Candidatus Baltobacteraceae bacterium]|nr:hypothetical protein [Candidatus Baltobacteraceae bacterium]
MLSVLVLAASVSAPQSSPPPLKTISHIHASPYCTAIRENIGPAVGALLANKPVIGEGKSMLLQMAQDSIHRSGPVVDVDMVKVDRVVGAMVKNLAATDAALNDLKHIPATPKTDEERRLAAMRDELRAVADAQRSALNVFSGMFESYSSNELRGKGNPLKAAVAAGNANTGTSAQDSSDTGTPIVVPPISSAAAGTASPTPLPAPQSAPAPIPQVDEGLAAFTPFAVLFNFVTTFQVQEEHLESQAARTIVSYSDECK